MAGDLALDDDAGIVDENIELTEARDCLVDQFLAKIGIRDIADDQLRRAAGGFDLCQYRFAALLVAPRHHHLRAMRGKCLGRAFANA